MLLPSGDAALIAVVLALGALLARHHGSRTARVAGPLAWETAIVLGLYACWMKSADWAITRAGGATGHALWVWRFERDVRLPSELSVQRALLPHPLWVQAANGFYAVVHVPALIAFLLWMYFRHPGHYARWRNVGAVLTGACLLIQMVPVAPPRLMRKLQCSSETWAAPTVKPRHPAASMSCQAL